MNVRLDFKEKMEGKKEKGGRGLEVNYRKGRNRTGRGSAG